MPELPSTLAPTTSASRRRLTSERYTRRKRTVIACQFCRLRKTRCDGVHPVCGFCKHHSARCIWGPVFEQEADAVYHGLKGGNLQTQTPTEREILQRLDDIHSLLLPKHQEPVASIASTSPITTASRESTFPSTSTWTSVYASARLENLLRWPIFGLVIEPKVAAIESFVLQASSAPNCDRVGRASGWTTSNRRNALGAAPGIQEHMLVALSKKFLNCVHPRNPIIEPGELLRYAKEATENGLGWDSPSCLVLIACAIACYASPWDKDAITTGSETPEWILQEDIASAEAYYFAARKRVGLLGCSMLDIQCLFFASVYERYALNPLQAWFYIQQASLRLQALQHQRRVSRDTDTIAGMDAFEHRLEQCLFWSIFKAENELLTELPFLPSGIHQLVRSDSMFPAPPSVITESAPTSYSPLESQDSLQDERSWYFYSAEISLRRTLNDTLHLLYRKSEQFWLDHVSFLVQQHAESERQIRLWCSHLPNSLHLDPLTPADNELSFFLQGRFFEWRDYILRPLLFYVFHRPADQMLSPEILKCAQECVSACAEGIEHYSHHHRHGSTWHICRRTFTFALLLIGIVIKDDPRLSAPSNWQCLVTVSIATLRKWGSGEHPDLHLMWSTLESALGIISDQNETSLPA